MGPTGLADVSRHVGGGSWLQEAKLMPSNRDQGDTFGYSVAIDGNVAVLGAPYIQCQAGNHCGTTMIFRYNGSSWNKEAGKLLRTRICETGICHQEKGSIYDSAPSPPPSWDLPLDNRSFGTAITRPGRQYEF